MIKILFEEKITAKLIPMANLTVWQELGSVSIRNGARWTADESSRSCQHAFCRLWCCSSFVFIEVAFSASPSFLPDALMPSPQ